MAAITNEKVIMKKADGMRPNVLFINSEADVPEYLKSSIIVRGEDITLATCTEGQEHCKIGSAIAWEKSRETSTGYNCWVKGNPEDLYVQDGFIFERAQPVTAQLIEFGEAIPEFMSSAKITVKEDGTIELDAGWGVQTATPGKRYVYAAYANGTYAFVDLDSESASQYFICDKNENITEQTLTDYFSDK